MRALAAASIAALALALAAPALAAADWGAIAVNPQTGKVGVSYDYSTPHHAKKRALVQCHQSGCRIAVWVFNQYAALVLKRNGVFVAGVGRTRNLAFLKAKERAHERSAKRYAWVYSG
ncbi:MAG TPA: DUF4189 domain-containing protein [Solirubrobacterales bacterium]|jgi:hypothetical protein|nr:DUF4189 domain-containing protein [Solirubrobacterales bacterium]